jgi:hypothetical protein
MTKNEIIEQIMFIDRYSAFIEDEMEKKLDFNVLRCLIRDLAKQIEVGNDTN